MRQLAGSLLWIALCMPAPAQDGKPVLVLEKGAHAYTISAIFFSADSKQLITVSEDKTIRFWDIAAGKQTKVLRTPIGLGADGQLRAAALSPDGKVLAVGGLGIRQGDKRPCPVYVIDLANDRLLKVIDGGESPIFALAFSRDGKRLAVGGLPDSTIRVVDVETGKLIASLHLPYKRSPRTLAFSPEDKYLAVIPTERGPLFMFHLATAKVGITMEEIGATHDFRWSPDGKRIGTASSSGVRIWDANGTLKKHWMVDRLCSAVHFTPDPNRLIVEARRDDGGYNFPFTLHADMGDEKPLHEHTCSNTVLSPDGKLLAGTLGNGTSGATVACWSAATGETVTTLPMFGAYATHRPGSLGWSADGKTVTLLDGWSFNLAKLEAGAPLPENEMRGPLTKVDDLSFKELHLRYFEIVKDKNVVADIKTPGGNFKSRTFVNKDTVVAGTNWGDGYLVRTIGGERLRTFPLHNAVVDYIAASPDGKLVASWSSHEKTACIIRPDQERPLLYLHITGAFDRKSKDRVYEWVVWTPDGPYACSPGGERTFGWHLDRGPKQLAGFAPAEAHKDLHRPELIRQAAEGR